MNIKDMIKVRGLTQQEFADDCCVSLSSIQKWSRTGMMPFWAYDLLMKYHIVLSVAED